MYGLFPKNETGTLGWCPISRLLRCFREVGQKHPKIPHLAAILERHLLEMPVELF
jgi:hypothetical protein